MCVVEVPYIWDSHQQKVTQLRKLSLVDRLYSKGRGWVQIQIHVGRLRSLWLMNIFPFQDHFLCVAAQKVCHPFQGLPSHTVVVEVGCQVVVGCFVKRLSEVHQHSMDLTTFAEAFCKVVDSLNELCYIGPTFTKHTLMVRYDVVPSDPLSVHDVFQCLADDHFDWCRFVV